MNASLNTTFKIKESLGLMELSLCNILREKSNDVLCELFKNGKHFYSLIKEIPGYVFFPLEKKSAKIILALKQKVVSDVSQLTYFSPPVSFLSPSFLSSFS